MATFSTCQCQDGVKVLTVMNEDVRALKDALENLTVKPGQAFPSLTN